MVKSFSRRISTICMSSTEAECHALCEGSNEGITVAITAQTFMEGLPSRTLCGDLRSGIPRNYSFICDWNLGSAGRLDPTE